MHYMGIIASVTTLTVFFVNPTKLATEVFAASVAFTGISWFFAFFKRRNTHCPLCKGTPLINSGALTHRKAVRWFPLNHGVTAILSIIVSHKFRCMYCGTLFDLLKTPSYQQTYRSDTDPGKQASGETHTPADPRDTRPSSHLRTPPAAMNPDTLDQAQKEHANDHEGP